MAKVDHTFNAKQSIYGRAFLGQGNQTAPVGTTDINPYFFEIGPIHVYNYSAGHNWSITPSISNSITAGVNYFHQTFSDANTNFAGVATAGFITGSPFVNAPNITIGNDFEPTGNTPPEGRQDITGAIDEALNWTKGRHQLRMGGEYRRAQVDEFYHRHAIGTFSFIGAQGPNGDGSVPWNTTDPDVAALADFMAGYLTKGSIAVGNPERTGLVAWFRPLCAGQLSGHDSIERQLRRSFRLHAADERQQEGSIGVPAESHSDGDRLPGAGHQPDLRQRLEQHQSAHRICVSAESSHPAW